MKNIAIFGAGGFGREVKTIIDAINRIDPTYNLIGFYDDGHQLGTEVNNIPILGGIEAINLHTEELYLVIAVANPNIKRKIINSITNPLIYFPSLIHPRASISSDDVKIEQGCIICEGTIITCNIKINSFVILNLLCTVGHDTVIEDYCSFMPSVNISGEVHIEECVYVGTGAKIINQLKIGRNTVIGAGATVTRTIPANCTAVGTPAIPIKTNK